MTILIAAPFPAPVVEKLRWETAVLTSVDGAEQRISKRAYPERSLEVEYVQDTGEFQAFQLLQNQLNSVGSSQVRVVDWTRAQRITAITPVGPNVKLTIADTSVFENAESIVVYSTCNNYESSPLIIFNATTLTVSASTGPLVGDFAAPIYLAHIETGFGVSRAAIRNKVKVKYVFDGISTTPAPVVEPVFRGYPVLTLQPLFRGDSSSGAIRDGVEKLQYSGRAVYDTRWVDSLISDDAAYIAQGPTELQTLKSFFAKYRGSCRAFWTHTHLSDIAVAQVTAANTTFFAETAGLRDADIKVRPWIAIRSADGVTSYHTITSIAADGQATCEVTIAPGLGGEVIELISWMKLSRLASDELIIEHLGADVSKLSANFVEVRNYTDTGTGVGGDRPPVARP